MPTEKEFHNVLVEVQDIVERLGDECEDPTSDTSFQLGKEEIGETYAMACTSTEFKYHIVGSTEAEHFGVVHLFDFESEISDRFNVQDAIGFIENSDYNVIFSELEDGQLQVNILEKGRDIDIDSESKRLESYEDISDELITQIAGHLVIHSIDSDLMEELKFRLRDRISSPHTWHSLNKGASNEIYGFTVGSEFFPFEPDFGIEDVHRAWTHMSNVANSGTRYLRHSFDLNREQEEGLVEISFDEDRISKYGGG